MSELDNFEKRFTNAWFSSGWAEIEPKKATEAKDLHKDLVVLESELEEINQKLENISQKQLRLENLAKLYNETPA